MRWSKRGLCALLAALLAIFVVLSLPARVATAASSRHKLRVNLAWQIALAAADFSPGILDGQFGANSRMALRQYAKRYFPGVNPYDPTNFSIYKALKVDVRHAIATYTISPLDAAQIGSVPMHWKMMAKVQSLPYRSLRDCIAEKFHCTKGLLRRLNPGISLRQLTVGEKLNVPNIRPFPKPGPLAEPTPAEAAKGPRASRLVINETLKTIKVYNRKKQQIALFHCSVAQDPDNLPVGKTVVKTMALNPDYTFNPKEWPEVHNEHTILVIPPGPRNPVGLAWMGLALPGYGIHGNAYPEMIGHTGSHGCFRLTNWDALTLFGMVHVGTKVKFVDNPEHPNAATKPAATTQPNN